MKLSVWLMENKLSFEAFGKMMKPPASRHSIHKWCKGLREPRPENKREIIRLTKGEVNAIDMLDAIRPPMKKK